MDYDKVYFPKTEMSQLVPTGYFSPETYAAYAESFDLSLLPTDNEPQFELNQCQSEFISLDYIPTTIFNDNQQQSMLMTIKTEKIWSSKEDLQSSISIDLPKPTNINTSITNTGTSTTDSSILLQQLQKQYQFYPSPLPSPPQYDFNHNIGNINNINNFSPISSINLPPSPSPSIEQQSTSPITTNFNTFSIKKEYLILPPSPPESNGAPSPFSEIKSEPDIDTENFIDINTLLEKSIINFQTTSTTPITTRKIVNNNKKTPTPATTNNSDRSSIIKKSTIDTTGGGVVIAPQDHQVLREYLQDTTFQKKHNLKPLALESLIGGFSVRGDIEPVISLALEHAKRDAQATCANLQISLDPQQWTTNQVHAWIRSTIEQFKLSQIDNLESKFPENGANLLCLTEDEFVRRVPESGGTIHAQLEIWKLACCENFLTDMTSPPPPSSSSSITNWMSDCPQNMDITDDEDDDLPSTIIPSSDNPTTIVTNGNPVNTTNSSSSSSPPSSAVPTTTIINNTTGTGNGISSTSSTNSTAQITPISGASSSSTVTPKPPRTGGSHIHLWQFLKELLATPQLHGTAIRWLDRNKGVFKIEDSVRVAKLWGRRKNRPAMNYDKLSRSIRQYYKKGIMKKTERSQRLVYQFCHPYCL